MVGTICHRLGPGRLPGASRRDVGAGIAMATAAFLAPASMVTAGALAGTGGASPLASLLAVAELAIGASVVLGVLVVPLAFAFGTLFWRRAPADPDLRMGARYGAETAFATMSAVCLFVGLLVVSPSASTLGVAGVIAGGLLFGAFLLVFATVSLGWFVVTVGALAGAYHEAARASEDPPVDEIAS